MSAKKKASAAELARVRARIDAEEAAELEAARASRDASAHRPEGAQRFFGLHGALNFQVVTAGKE